MVGRAEKVRRTRRVDPAHICRGDCRRRAGWPKFRLPGSLHQSRRSCSANCCPAVVWVYIVRRCFPIPTDLKIPEEVLAESGIDDMLWVIFVHSHPAAWVAAQLISGSPWPTAGSQVRAEPAGVSLGMGWLMSDSDLVTATGNLQRDHFRSHRPSP